MGAIELWLPIAVVNCVRLMLRAASASGLASTRTAYCCAPNTCTCPTPSTADSAGAMTSSPKASSCVSVCVSLCSASRMMGASAGLDLR